MALTTLADNKAYLGITVSTFDSLIEIIRKSVEQSVLNYCEQDFELKTITDERHDGVDSDIIVPYKFPIVNVTSVKFDDDALDADAYYFNESCIKLLERTTPFKRGVVKVSYSYGYSVIPDDVKLCIYQGVKAEYQRKGSNTEHISSRSKEGESESYTSAWDTASGLPKAIISKLQRYRVYECPNSEMAQRNR